MLNVATQVITELFGTIFVAWLSCEAVQVLIGLLCFGIALKYLLSLFRI